MDLGIGKRIKQKRLELGLTQLELAQKMGYTSRAAICKVEKGQDNITSDRVTKFANALGCSESYIMGWEKESGEKTPHGQLLDAYANKDRQEKANALYDQYESLSPEKQAQFDNFLKFLQSDSELPHLH